MFDPKPHVSQALAHLRFGVQACALVLGLALAANVGVWAVAHFTDARWTEKTEMVETAPPPRVVEGGAVSRTGKEVVARTATVEETVRVPSATEVTLRDTWRLSGWVGSVAVIGLLFLTLQGVVIGGGASVPGIEKAVTAGSWAIALTLLCLPVQGVIASFPTDGVFGSYGAMADVSEAIKSEAEGAPGQLGVIVQRFLLPAACLGMTVFVAVRFTSGIEQGVLSTTASEAELRLMEEMERSRKASGTQGRAQGALSVTLHEEGSQAASHPAAPARPEPLQRPISSASPGVAPGRVI